MTREIEQKIFDNFAKAHPRETHATWPDRFWEFFQREYPGISKEKMEQLLKEIEGE